MARDRATTAPTPLPANRILTRRALIALTAPTLGAAGFTAALLRRPQQAAAAEADPGGNEAHESGLTAHRRAYYDRARF